MDWENNWSGDHQVSYSGHTVHLGIYIDDATITFKVIIIIVTIVVDVTFIQTWLIQSAECVKEQLFYKSRKIRYKSFLSLRFTGAVIDVLAQGISMTTFQVGCGSIRLYPRGTCSCGHLEVLDGTQVIE